MRFAKSFLCLCLCSVSGTLRADTIQGFVLNSTFGASSNTVGTASALIRIDTTTGLVVSGTLSTSETSFGVPSAFQGDLSIDSQSYSSSTGEDDVDLSNSAVSIDLLFPTSLVNYTGSAICSVAHLCAGSSPGLYSVSGIAFRAAVPGANEAVIGTFSSGQLTPTPEPQSLLLVSSGFLGCFSITLFRYSKKKARTVSCV